MSRFYIIMLGAVALVISGVGAVFSIFGLTHLFAGAPVSVGIMAGSLEAAKLVSAGFLYRYWGHINRLMRTYLSVSVVVLSCITSLGVFGYLSHAYFKSSAVSREHQLRISQLKAEDTAIHTQIHRAEEFIDTIPRNRISKKLALYDQSRGHIGSLQRRSDAIQEEIRKHELQNFDSQADIGPLVDVSETLGVKVDTVAKALILIFVSVFDPLAICLVFAWSLAIRLREKYRGNEYRIAALSVASPVDHRRHRYKKAA